MFYPEISKNKPETFNKAKFSVYCAASLMYMLKKQRDAVGLSIFSDEVKVNTPAKSSSVHHKLLYMELERLLASNEKNHTTRAAEALHEIAENIHKRSLVIIFSDMMDNSLGEEELFSALQHMKHNKHEVILFHVTDKAKEQDFE